MRYAILAALALSACATYDRPTYNDRTGCVESWTHSGTTIGMQASIEDRPDDLRAFNSTVFRRSAAVPRYAVGATFQFSKREQCPAPHENPVLVEAYRKGAKQ